MSKFKVAYIDESREEIGKFQRFCFPTLEVVPIIPKASIEETCQEIIESHVDAVVSDFEFSEQANNIKYDGSNIISLFLSKREGFPVFIFTSYEPEAISKSTDVNIVYEKGEKYLTDEDGNTIKNERLIERIRLQIEKYKHRIEVEEKRLIDLINLSKKRKLDAVEKEELAALDSKIERALDKESRITNILRNDKEASELSELLRRVDELAKSLGKQK